MASGLSPMSRGAPLRSGGLLPHSADAHSQTMVIWLVVRTEHRDMLLTGDSDL